MHGCLRNRTHSDIGAGEAAGSDPLASMPEGKTVTFGLDIGGTPTDYELQGLPDPSELTESSIRPPGCRRASHIGQPTVGVPAPGDGPHLPLRG